MISKGIIFSVYLSIMVLSIYVSVCVCVYMTVGLEMKLISSLIKLIIINGNNTDVCH